MPDGPGQIYKAMTAVMLEVGVVGKNKKNKEQNYDFRSIDDVFASCQEILAKHCVCVIPFVVSHEYIERPTSRGGVATTCHALVDHTFYHHDGSSVTARMLGEATDYSDKASNKAMSAAIKYALTESLLIPTIEPKDSEFTSPEIPAGDSVRTEPAKTAPPIKAHQKASEPERAFKGDTSFAFETPDSDEDLALLYIECANLSGYKMAKENYRFKTRELTTTDIVKAISTPRGTTPIPEHRALVFELCKAGVESKMSLAQIILMWKKALEKDKDSKNLLDLLIKQGDGYKELFKGGDVSF